LGEVAGEEGDGWSCLRCGSVIKHVDRWKEVIGEDPPTENKQEKNEVGEVKEGRSGKESSIEEIVTPESEEVEEEDGGEANSEEGQNLFG
jgi:peroxin-2